MQNLPENLISLYEIEWKSVEEGSDYDRNLIAILAHDRRQHTVESLSVLTATDVDLTKQHIERHAFLLVSTTNGEVSFVSDGYREFAGKRLERERSRVINMVIDNLFSNPDSSSALLYLPIYLHQTGRLDDLLDYLSPEHIGSMVEHARSWKPVQQQTSLGIKTAIKLERDGDLVRLGIQESTIVESERVETWRAQVEACMALNQDESALNVAQSCVSQEDRLHLLAVICRAKKQKNIPIDSELDQELRQLAKKIPRTTLGAKGLEIATDLIYSHPEIAIEFARESSNSDKINSFSDSSIANFSMGMIEASANVEKRFDALSALRKQIENPRLKNFSASLSLLFGGYSAAQVIEEVEKFHDAESKISLIRQWCNENRSKLDALKVVEYGLALVIKATTYAPNARVYREIATPLAYSEELEQVKPLVARFQSQTNTTLRIGPTLEHVRLELLLARAE